MNIGVDQTWWFSYKQACSISGAFHWRTNYHKSYLWALGSVSFSGKKEAVTHFSNELAA